MVVPRLRQMEKGSRAAIPFRVTVGGKVTKPLRAGSAGLRSVGVLCE